MEIRSHVIDSKDANVAARSVCTWFNAMRPKVELVAVAQMFFEGSLRTTIFWKRAASYVGDEANSGQKLRPKTGEKRVTRKLLKIDKLPNSARDAIVELRRQGKIWSQIDHISSLPFSENWLHDGAGFVNWEVLPAEVLALFSSRRLPKASLHRWYDIRVEQSGGL